MSDRPALSPATLPRPGEVALPTAINAALDVPADKLPAASRSSAATSAPRWMPSRAAAAPPSWSSRSS